MTAENPGGLRIFGGHVYVGESAYLNSYVDAGKAFRVVSCVTCEDTGWRGTVRGGIVCGCEAGDDVYLVEVDRILDNADGAQSAAEVARARKRPELPVTDSGIA